jgi:hypothetical protein
MKAVYFGSTFCSLATLKRLLLLTDELTFIDRPSVFSETGGFGTIGAPAEIRGYNTDGLPVKLGAIELNRGRHDLFHPFIASDFANERFVRVFADGLRQSDDFAFKFIQPAGNYGGIDGYAVRSALIEDETLAARTYETADLTNPAIGLATAQGRRANFLSCLFTASVSITAALIAAEELGAVPITDDPFMNRLLALRATDRAFVGADAATAQLIGFSIAQSVVPDEALQHLTISDVFEYRRITSDAYAAWLVEMNRLASMIEGAEDLEALQDTLTNLLAREVRPKVQEYLSELASCRDRLWGDLIKRTVGDWKVPALLLAFTGRLSFPDALAVYAMTAVPAIVDQFTLRRHAARKNAYSYLVKAVPTVQ